MPFRWIVIWFCLFAVFERPAANACEWCKRFGVKETVLAGEKAGGTFFGKTPPAAKTRHYYIAAEPVVWTWVPLGENVSKPTPLPPDLVSRPTSAKTRYVQYTDATFTRRVLDTPRLGIVGPILRGVTGEYLAVTFLNKSGTPLSMHPHGVKYDKDSEGAYGKPDTGKGSAVAPGGQFTYVWKLDEMSGPQAGEPSSKCWLYHSHCLDEEEVNAGLFGLIVVTDPKRARPDGTPSDIDREIAAIFYIFDETPEDEALEYKDVPLLVPMVPRTTLETMALQEVSGRHSINGLLFGNLAGLEMREGERVRWYLASLGEENGMHTAHWHGARVREEGRRVVDVVALLPGETKVADQIADNPGTWLLHCHVSDHMMEGMFANYVVKPRDAVSPPDAFLGMSAALSSLEITKAEIQLDFASKDEGAAVVHLKGSVASYSGFFLPKNPVSVTIANRQVALDFIDKETAGSDGVAFKVAGVNAQGVLLNETMEFEIVIKGVKWRDVLSGAGLHLKANQGVKIPIGLKLGETSHQSNLSLKVKREGEKLNASESR